MLVAVLDGVDETFAIADTLPWVAAAPQALLINDLRFSLGHEGRRCPTFDV